MIVKHSQYSTQPSTGKNKDKQLSGNDLCDMIKGCVAGYVKRSQPGGSQAQVRYVSSSVLKTKWRLCRAQMPNVPGIKEALRARNSAYRSPLEAL